MLTEFFVYRGVIEKLEVGPLAPHIVAFAQAMKEQGYTRSVARIHVRVVARLSKWLRKRKLEAGDLCEARLDEFLRGREGSRPGVACTVRALLAHLRRVGVAAAAKRAATSSSFREVLQRDFIRYLNDERRLVDSTVNAYVSVARQLLVDSCGSSRSRLRKLDATGVTDFVLRHARDGGPGLAQNMTTALRSFLRFLYMRGEIRSDLASCVPTVPSWRLTRLPIALKPQEVTQLIRTCDRRSPAGRRDRAVLMLLSRLGLRACEVEALKLDDIDWLAGEIIVRGKGSGGVLPLPPDVGAALAAYVREGRPVCTTRQFFVSVRAPFRGLTSHGVSCTVARAVDRAGLHPPHRGAHLLRHTAASEMLRRGASLGEIGDVLRHRKIDTTAIYAKVDLSRLRALAQQWPGGAA
jgi:integrase/recombinase XerD